jgi:hypothetical protein
VLDGHTGGGGRGGEELESRWDVVTNRCFQSPKFHHKPVKGCQKNNAQDLRYALSHVFQTLTAVLRTPDRCR